MARRLLCLLLAILAIIPLYGCEKEQEPDPVSVDIALVEGGEAKLYIRLPADTPAQILYAKDRLVFHVKERTGATLECGTEAKAGAPTITLGNNIDEFSAKRCEKTEGDVYRIHAAEQRITVVAANEAFLYDAIDALIEKMAYDAETNTLRLSGVLDETAAGDKTSLRYLFTQGDSLESASAHHAYLTNPEGIAGEQGGCFDGTYYYQAFVKKHTASNEENNAVRIGKFDYKTGEAVAYSEVLALNHANDMTINPQTGELFVVHNNPHRTRVSVLSTDTLALLRTVELQPEIYGLSYCRSRDAFAAALSSSFNMRVLDANLALADDKLFVGTTLTANYTRQGICSDDTFIYHVLWDGKRKSKPTFQNVISVYDWYGNFCGLINFAIGVIEPENISITQDGTLIVVASTKKGGGAYEIRPTSVRKK